VLFRSGGGVVIKDTERLMTELLATDEQQRIQAAGKILFSIRDNFNKIETLQGRVSVSINDEPSLINGNFYMNRRGRDDGLLEPMPWQYAIKIEDSQNGLNLFTSDPQAVIPKIWLVDNGKESKSLPSMLSTQLPNILLSPIVAACETFSDKDHRFNKDIFFEDTVVNVHKSETQEEQNRQGGPFWVVQTDRRGTFWLSDKGELRSVYQQGNAGNSIDISYVRYERVGEIEYPAEIIISFSAKNSQGEDLIKSFTGKADKQAKIRVTLKDMKINESIHESKFSGK
jgi:hypothetical protein